MEGGIQSCTETKYLSLEMPMRKTLCNMSGSRRKWWDLTYSQVKKIPRCNSWVDIRDDRKHVTSAGRL